MTVHQALQRIEQRMIRLNAERRDHLLSDAEQLLHRQFVGSLVLLAKREGIAPDAPWDTAMREHIAHLAADIRDQWRAWARKTQSVALLHHANEEVGLFSRAAVSLEHERCVSERGSS